MDLYTSTSYQLSRRLTLNYSTSFGIASRLFERRMQKHIYAVYGFVRIADEIVDTYQGTDQAKQLNSLQRDVLEAINIGYSANPIIHSFTSTAKKYGIGKELIVPFLDSMRMDIDKRTYTKKLYETYIYGSAEVIGLMCLMIFVDGDKSRYDALKHGAQSLGAGYQKVNFLRDIADDAGRLGRWYFPSGSYDTFNEAQKVTIINDIRSDFTTAKEALAQLPSGARRAVAMSLVYYQALLDKLNRTSASEIKYTRVRVPNIKKYALLVKGLLS